MNINLNNGGKKQYGLVVPSKKKKKKKIIAVDAGSSKETSGDYDFKTQINIRNAALKKSGEQQRLKAAELYKDALSQDSTVFDYDGVYDDISTRTRDEQRKEKRKNEVKTSKYIDTLKRTAKQREFVQEMAKDRKAFREQAEEEEKYGKVTEVFVTGAYKRRLEERRQYELEEARRAAEEAKNDVRKRGGLTEFYSGMLNELEDKSRNIVAKTTDEVTATNETNKSTVPQNETNTLSTGTTEKLISNDKNETEQEKAKWRKQKQIELEKQIEVAKATRKRKLEENKPKAQQPKTTQDQVEAARQRALERRKKMMLDRARKK